MKVRMFGGVVSSIIVLLSILCLPSGVFACSGTPRNWVAEADLIVLGQVVTVEPAPGALGGASIPVRLTLRVDKVLKGAAPDRLSYLEPGVYEAESDDPDDWSYAGEDGSCATLDSNPVGKHTLALLVRNDRGDLTVVSPPAAPVYADRPEQLHSALVAYGLPRMPATGAGGAQDEPRGAIAMVVLSLASVAAGASLVRLEGNT